MSKVKRAVCEVTGCNGDDVVINKNQKTVLFRDGHNLRRLATVQSKDNVQWETSVEEVAKTRVAVLLASI